MLEGRCGLGFAVVDRDGAPVGSISIAAIELRFEGGRRERLAERLLGASRDPTRLQEEAATR